MWGTTRENSSPISKSVERVSQDLIIRFGSLVLHSRTLDECRKGIDDVGDVESMNLENLGSDLIPDFATGNGCFLASPTEGVFLEKNAKGVEVVKGNLYRTNTDYIHNQVP